MCPLEEPQEGVQSCLQEIFNGPYFCPSQDRLTTTWPSRPGTDDGGSQRSASKHRIRLIPVRDGDAGVLYNTAAVYDADGRYLASTERTTFPHQRLLGEVLLQARNLGLSVFETRYARVGVYICYDRHFPRARARSA